MRVVPLCGIALEAHGDAAAVLVAVALLSTEHEAAHELDDRGEAALGDVS